MKSKLDVKIALIGKQGIGKSALIERFRKDTFNTRIENTIGAAFATLERLSKDGFETIRVNIWDTAGMERFKSLVPMYIRDATTVFVCFDSPYIEDVQDQIEFVRETNEKCIIVLVQTKTDLQSSYESRDLSKFASENGYKIYRTSSKLGTGVHILFDDCIENAYQYKKSLIAESREIRQPVEEVNVVPRYFPLAGCCILM